MHVRTAKENAEEWNTDYTDETDVHGSGIEVLIA